MDGNAVGLANASDAIVPAPEPSTTMLVSFGGLVLFWRRRSTTTNN
jgi:hypothetical protein